MRLLPQLLRLRLLLPSFQTPASPSPLAAAQATPSAPDAVSQAQERSTGWLTANTPLPLESETSDCRSAEAIVEVKHVSARLRLSAAHCNLARRPELHNRAKCGMAVVQ